MASAFTKIASFSVSTSVNIYTFSSIPQTYKHLMVLGQVATSSSNANADLTINGLSSYSYEKVIADGGETATSSASSTSSSISMSTSMSLSNSLFVFKLNFPYYTDSTTKPSVLGVCSVSSSSTAQRPYVVNVSGAGNTSGAVSSISIALNAAARDNLGIISLYGVS